MPSLYFVSTAIKPYCVDGQTPPSVSTLGSQSEEIVYIVKRPDRRIQDWEGVARCSEFAQRLDKRSSSIKHSSVTSRNSGKCACRQTNETAKDSSWMKLFEDTLHESIAGHARRRRRHDAFLEPKLVRLKSRLSLQKNQTHTQLTTNTEYKSTQAERNEVLRSLPPVSSASCPLIELLAVTTMETEHGHRLEVAAFRKTNESKHKKHPRLHHGTVQAPWTMCSRPVGRLHTRTEQLSGTNLDTPRTAHGTRYRSKNHGEE